VSCCFIFANWASAFSLADFAMRRPFFERIQPLPLRGSGRSVC
jgi:hypothetical protein